MYQTRDHMTETLQERTLQLLVDELLDRIPHAIVRKRGMPVEVAGLVYAGRLVDLLSERHALPPHVFHGVGEDTIVLHAPPRPPHKRLRRR